LTCQERGDRRRGGVVGGQPAVIGGGLSPLPTRNPSYVIQGTKSAIHVAMSSAIFARRMCTAISTLSHVMPALVAGIHVFFRCGIRVDARDKPAHDATA
jgi:hypothetical protein